MNILPGPVVFDNSELVAICYILIGYACIVPIVVGLLIAIFTKFHYKFSIVMMIAATILFGTWVFFDQAFNQYSVSANYLDRNDWLYYTFVVTITVLGLLIILSQIILIIKLLVSKYRTHRLKY